MTLSHPILTCACMVITIAVILLLIRRRHRSATIVCIGFGFTSLALAAGSLSITLHPSREVTVMVDLSPSTRGAAYRNREVLEQRVRELMGNDSRRIVAFADHVEPMPDQITGREIPCDRTRFDPPPADAILLFSDGQFALPTAAPPTYCVIDPQLEAVSDAAITRLSASGNIIAADAGNTGEARSLSWTGTDSAVPQVVPQGHAVIQGGTATSDTIAARLTTGDLWPENDTLSIHRPPPVELQRWWIGDGSPLPPSIGWTVFDRLIFRSIPRHISMPASSYCRTSPPMRSA